MIENRLLFWTVLAIVIYWIVGLAPTGTYSSSIASLLLLIGATLTFLRYGPEAWRVVVFQHRNPDAKDGDGSHLAAYGVTLLSAGSIYTGAFGLLWVMADQPDSWLATPASGFGRAMMACGFGLLFISPDVNREGLHMSGACWIIPTSVMVLLGSFFFGLQIGRGEIASIDPRSSCPPYLSVKGSRMMVYHAPGDPYYERTIPHACFVSRDLAERAGFRSAS